MELFIWIAFFRPFSFLLSSILFCFAIKISAFCLGFRSGFALLFALVRIPGTLKNENITCLMFNFNPIFLARRPDIDFMPCERVDFMLLGFLSYCKYLLCIQGCCACMS